MLHAAPWGKGALAKEGPRVDTWLKVLALSVGGTLGVNARYWLGAWMSRWASPQFPWATVVINISGSFLIGFLTVALSRWLPHPNVRLLAITGFLGGYTTFSTFENDSLALWERGQRAFTAANIGGSVIVGFAAVVLGTALARGLVESTPERAAAGVSASGAVSESRHRLVGSRGSDTSFARAANRRGTGATNEERSSNDPR
jgi:CrcB protein